MCLSSGPTIHLYIADTGVLSDDDLYHRVYQSVSRSRQEKTDAFRFRKDRNLSLGVAWLLRYGIQDFKRLNEEEAECLSKDLRYASHGKPFLRAPFFFNLSHSETTAICALSDFEIGCDVEYERDLSIDSFMRHLTSDEAAALKNCKNDLEKEKLFFKIWTLKESFLKCTGDGLSLPLNSFSVLLDSEVRFIKTPLDETVSYQLYHFEECNVHFGLCVKVPRKGGEFIEPIPADSIRIFRKTIS